MGEDPLQSGTEVTFSGCQVQVLVSSSAGEIADTYTTMTFWQMVQISGIHICNLQYRKNIQSMENSIATQPICFIIKSFINRDCTYSP